MPLACVTFATDFRITGWNPAAERLFGWTAAEIIGRSAYATLVPAEAAEHVAGIEARLAAGDLEAHGMNENVTKDGRRLVCHWHNTPLFDEAGRVTGYLSLAEDVTARVAAERALAESEARLRAIVEQAGDIIYTADLAGRFTMINPAGRRLTGYGPDEVDSLTVERVVAPEHLAAARALTAAKLRGEADITTYTLDFLTKDGRRVPLEVTCRPLCDAAGTPVGVLGIARDLSERRAAEAERERLLGELRAALAAERAARAAAEAAAAALKASQAQLVQAGKLAAVGTLAAGVAHELNQPLMVIRGQTQLLLANGDDPERRAQKLARIEKQTEKMATIIDHLRAFGRPRPARPPAPVDLNQMVREALLLISAQLAERGIELRLALAEPAPVALADAGEVEQIALNLLINARDALAPDGAPAGPGAVVTVRTWADGGAVHLAVLDTGPGLAPAVLERLFEPFFTTKPIGQGTGLGLSISRDLARKWGGELTLENREDGPGAIATLTLPAAPATGASSAA
jgi:PAS domain S-box-containing protein